MEQENTIATLSAAQRLRLAFIEFRVWFYGEVARKHVLERFEVATAAGTRDLMLYKQLAPHNVSYEHKQYRYLPTFQPLFQHDPDKVLAALTTGTTAADTGTSVETISHAVPRPEHPCNHNPGHSHAAGAGADLLVHEERPKPSGHRPALAGGFGASVAHPCV